MADKPQPKYKRQSEAACESRLHPERFCPRCSLRLTSRNPLIAKKRHCALCESELTAGHVLVASY